MENIITNSSLPNNKNYDYRGDKNELETGDVVSVGKQENYTLVKAPVSYFKNDREGDLQNVPIYQQKIEITKKGFTEEIERFENSVKYNKNEVIYRKEISENGDVFFKSEETYNNLELVGIKETGKSRNKKNSFSRTLTQDDRGNYTDKISFFNKKRQETLSLNLVATTKELGNKIAEIEKNGELYAIFTNQNAAAKYFDKKVNKNLEKNNINLNF